jgi:hypothetical protein
MEAAPEIPGDRPEMQGGCEPNRASARAAGKIRLQSLDDLDGRTSAYRKTAELIDRVEADLGGADQLSTAQQQIIRRAALTGAMIEDLGAKWLSGMPIDLALFCTLSNAERRLYETVGLNRRPRDVTPDIGSYLASREPEAAA